MSIVRLPREFTNLMTLIILVVLAATSQAVDWRRSDLPAQSFLAPGFEISPYDRQVAEQTKKLQSDSDKVRAGAAEALGYLRAYSAPDALAQALTDDYAIVKREAAMSLGWCGNRTHVGPLLDALEDRDWVVRQAAWVALGNMTAMEMPFDALAKRSVRNRQIQKWREWWADVPAEAPPADVIELLNSDDLEARLRAVRALGALGGEGASDAVLRIVTPYRSISYRSLAAVEKNVVQCGIRALGRLREPKALKVLIDFLDTVGWARYAADALGDFGSPAAVAPLIAAYPKFSRHLHDRQDNPDLCPRDDRFSGDNTQDRMHETPYNIALTLSRLPLHDPNSIAGLRKISPYLVANLPTSWDSGVFYEIEAAQLVTAYLLERAGMRQEIIDIAFAAAGQISRERPRVTGDEKTPEEIIRKLALRMYGDVPDIATWLPAFCRHSDVPRLIEMLEHPDGWISINSAKALMFIGDQRVVGPIAGLLRESKTEAEWGYSGALEHAEYDDPAPRRREAFIMALGRLGAAQHDQLLIKILTDQRNVLEMHHAAALALDELGTPEGLAALEHAEADHPFHSVRLVAREALWRRDRLPKALASPQTRPTQSKSHLRPSPPMSGSQKSPRR